MEPVGTSYITGFVLVFVLIYLLAYCIVFRNWNRKYRPEASSCLISLAHGTPAALMSTLSIIDQPQPLFASRNSDFQNMILDFSISYFLVDLLHYLIFVPSDVLFIVHHLATLFVLITARFATSYGAFSILVILVLAEVTSFCQNVWTLANARRADFPNAAKLYAFLSPPFYTFYTVVRGFAAPFFIYKMGAFYFSGEADRLLPKWMWASWMIVVAVGVLLSLLWILNLWSQLIKERKSSIEQKVR